MPLVVLLYAVTAPLLNPYTVGLPLGVRTLVFSAHIALGAIVAGAMFPIALRRFADQSVSRMFFIDLVGCAMAPFAFWVALSVLGLWVVGASAVVSYAAVGAILALRRPA